MVKNYNFTTSLIRKFIAFANFVCNYPQCCSKKLNYKYLNNFSPKKYYSENQITNP